MTTRLAIPALDNLDRVPHSKAVWRTEPCKGAANQQICVQYAGDIIAKTYVSSVPDWAKVVQWRYGWPPA